MTATTIKQPTPYMCTHCPHITAPIALMGALPCADRGLHLPGHHRGGDRQGAGSAGTTGGQGPRCLAASTPAKRAQRDPRASQGPSGYGTCAISQATREGRMPRAVWRFLVAEPEVSCSLHFLPVDSQSMRTRSCTFFSRTCVSCMTERMSLPCVCC
jgi:hypothetical protein